MAPSFYSYDSTDSLQYLFDYTQKQTDNSVRDEEKLEEVEPLPELNDEAEERYRTTQCQERT